ncbi:MAG: hypothetical protein AVDCRST_MAG40-427, partial [uncultured Gemmatimonadaceae bacterium]
DLPQPDIHDQAERSSTQRGYAAEPVRTGPRRAVPAHHALWRDRVHPGAPGRVVHRHDGLRQRSVPGALARRARRAPHVGRPVQPAGEAARAGRGREHAVGCV